MLKGIIVIDLPKRCADCPLKTENKIGTYCVPANEYFDGENSAGEKTEWCPLKILPRYKNDRGNFTTEQLYRIFGWNECLEEILE